MTRYSLHCPCGERIPLPPQSPLGKFDDQAPEPKLQRWPLSFFCHYCGIRSVHEAQETEPEEIGRLDLCESEHSFWHVQIRCDHGNCGKRFFIYTLKPASAAPEDVLYVLLHAKPPITCGETDHILDTRMVLYCGPLIQAAAKADRSG